jgi:hypothetical protein
MPTRRTVLALFAVLVAAVALPDPADAQGLDQFRKDGVIAERFDGYVEIRVDNPPAAARRLVDQVNAKRRDVYQTRAAEQNVSPTAVGKVYAEQILQRAPKGTYFKQPNGSYVRK